MTLAWLEDASDDIAIIQIDKKIINKKHMLFVETFPHLFALQVDCQSHFSAFPMISVQFSAAEHAK